MTSQLLSTPARHPFSLAALVDKAWHTTREAAFKAAELTWSAPFCTIAETAVVTVLRKIVHGELRIYTPTQTYIFPTEEERALDVDPQLRAEIRVLSPTFWLRLCTMSDLGFAEAFMYGEVECSDLVSLFNIFLRNRERIAGLDSRLSYLFSLPQKLTSSRFLNTISNSRNNISAHYDISNEMFMGFLSTDMTYSCAIFPDLDADLSPSVASSPPLVASPMQDFADVNVRPVDVAYAQSELRASSSTPPSTTTGASTPTVVSTEEFPSDPVKFPQSAFGAEDQVEFQDEDPLYLAQMRKLRHIIRKADIRPGHRVLEIGSGWGSLSILIASTIPETTVDTLTLSVHQKTLVRQRVDAAGLGNEDEDVQPRVRVHLMDYRNMPAEWEGAFDRVVSVEMVEAVGKEFLETYWATIDWALKKDTGVGVVQGITIPEARYETYVQEVDFIRKWVLFPGGILPTLTLLTNTLATASRGRLVVDSVSNIGPHYARTLREWRRRFEARFEDVIVPALKQEYPEVMDGPRGREEIEVFRRKWIYYYCYCEVGFTTRTLGDHIITFTREGNEEYGCQVFV